MTEILDRLEAIMDEKTPLKERKKIINILIELVQNFYHHRERFEVDDGFNSYGCIVFNSEDGGVKIISANFIKIEKLKILMEAGEDYNAIVGLPFNLVEQKEA